MGQALRRMPGARQQRHDQPPPPQPWWPSPEANAALYRTVIVRLRFHQPTIDYVTRRTAEGKTKAEIIRCLKRYVAREVWAYLHPSRHLRADPAPNPCVADRALRSATH